jgi:hypothetical protein
MDEVTILEAIASGTKGYVDAAASPADFVQAIRIVSQDWSGLHAEYFPCSLNA